MGAKDSFERHARQGVGPMMPGTGEPRPFESVNEAVFKQSPLAISDGLPRALEFRRKAESWFSFPYHCLMNVEYHPHERLTLTFSTHKVVLTGRNLESLYDGIRSQTRGRVEEMDRATQFATDEDEPEVHEIEVAKIGMGASRGPIVETTSPSSS
ncbi:MAG: hypothetical protein GY937_10440 [bacterium]|nr:hypothetical protein [bacterium]